MFLGFGLIKLDLKTKSENGLVSCHSDPLKLCQDICCCLEDTFLLRLHGDAGASPRSAVPNLSPSPAGVHQHGLCQHRDQQGVWIPGDKVQVGGAWTDLHGKVEHRQHPGDRDRPGRPGWGELFLWMSVGSCRILIKWL